MKYILHCGQMLSFSNFFTPKKGEQKVRSSIKGYLSSLLQIQKLILVLFNVFTHALFLYHINIRSVLRVPTNSEKTYERHEKL